MALTEADYRTLGVVDEVDDRPCHWIDSDGRALCLSTLTGPPRATHPGEVCIAEGHVQCAKCIEIAVVLGAPL